MKNDVCVLIWKVYHPWIKHYIFRIFIGYIHMYIFTHIVFVMKKTTLLKIFWVAFLSLRFLCTICNFLKSKKHVFITWAVLKILLKLCYLSSGNNYSIISRNSIIYSPNQFSDEWCPYVSIVFIVVLIYFSVKKNFFTDACFSNWF